VKMFSNLRLVLRLEISGVLFLRPLHPFVAWYINTGVPLPLPGNNILHSCNVVLSPARG
jgi:hypothetical protein